jgi:UPF0716 family protein affecting phage T7 exclusion
MPQSTAAGVITAIATVVIAVGGLLSALTLLIPILRQTRALKTQVTQVHTIVNQQRTDMERYQRALVTALQNANVDVPDDQSIEKP